jgi:hypothetical protein
VTRTGLLRYRELAGEGVGAWLAAGFRQRDFFPNRSFYLHKAAPEGYTLAAGSGFRPDPSELWEVVLFALPPATDGLPTDLFFDDEIQWHRQQFSLEGQVAVASVFVRGSKLYTAAYQSDLVQRISRRRQYKTLVDSRLRGWDRMLMNSILQFALERGLTTVNVPTADYARQQTDRARSVQPELFDRVYDRHVRDNYDVQRRDRWWAIDVAANRRRIVLGEQKTERSSTTKTICLCHDIERGLGHRQAEPAFVAVAEAVATETLRAMLDAEAELGIHATYNVVGTLVPGVRDQIERAGHCLGFHTFDHSLERRGSRVRSLLASRLGVGRVPDGTPTRLQLSRCRSVDYRVKGYRPAQSRLGADTDEANLAHHNFEWLASSSQSLGISEPGIENGIVKVPIRFDDFPLHRGMSYEDWEARILDVARRAEFLALSLHDCYGPLWVERYPALLNRLMDLGTLRTIDQVAAEVTLEDAS